jgi:hypothetical protein
VSIHPLIELANEKQVKQAKGFTAIAVDLKGSELELKYNEEKANALKRHEAGKKYLGVKSGRIPSGRQNGKDDAHASMAIAAFCKAGGEAPKLPDGSELQILDSLVPLRTATPDSSKGDADPNKGVDDIDLLAMLPDNRLAVVCVKYLAAEATRGGAGDTPLRALLRGLAQVAMIDGNAEEFRAEILEATGRTTSEECPALIIAAAPRYWELCRRREAQKGALWIRETERLGREVAVEIGVEVFFTTLEIEGDPQWEYTPEGPLLTSSLVMNPSWESTAGKVKPKPKAKKNANATEIVEGNMDKPQVEYSIRGSFEAGDRIDHKTLGLGVVQGSLGHGKIRVLFGEDLKALIHERP